MSLELTDDLHLLDCFVMIHAERLTHAEVSKVTKSLQLLQTQKGAAIAFGWKLCLAYCCFELAARRCHVLEHALTVDSSCSR